MTEDSVLDRVIEEVGVFFEPIAIAAQDSPAGADYRAIVLEAIGIDPTEVDDARDQFESIAAVATDPDDLLQSTGDDPVESLEELDELLDSFEDLVETIQSLGSDLADEDPAVVTEQLISFLTVSYLQRRFPRAYLAGMTLSVISVEPPEPDMNAIAQAELTPYTAGVGGEAELDIDYLADLLDDPVDALVDAWLPDADQGAEETLYTIESTILPTLVATLGEWGLQVDVARNRPTVDEDGDLQISRPIRIGTRVGDAAIMIRVAVAVTDDGLALFFDASGDLDGKTESENWVAGFGINGEAGPALLDPDGLEPVDEDDNVSLTASGSVDRLPATPGEPDYVLGPPNDSRIEIGTLGASGQLEADSNGVAIDVLAEATDASFVLDPAGADGFVSSIIPEDGVAIDADLGLGWATDRGPYIEGGTGGLDVDLPVHFSIGEALAVDYLHLGMTPDPDSEPLTVPVSIAASPEVELGPVDAVIEEIGLQAELAFPNAGDGNLGVIDVSLGFQPPSGAGLSVDAGVVVGGGFLTFEPEEGRYAGVLELSIGEITLNAVGLLTTELPGGESGFSLLLIITSEFPAIQLGFGFRLEGVGGLLGINRTMDVDALRAGLRNGTMGSILFPEDPVRNAPEIVSDRRAVFPPATGQHVFGPMAKLGWGTPTLFTADIGVLLELPDPIRIVILGRLHAALPDEQAALIVFNMDAMGVVDLEENEASVDATLFDSRLVQYDLSGDMAMRTNWGDDPDFVLSIGGFHPQYEPPEGFPSLDRLAVEIGPGNPVLRYEGYVAITSNTVQFGAGAELYAEAGGFELDGHMGFDALIQFDPFEFIVDIAAGIALRRSGSSIASIDLEGTLAGPTPWSIHGEATVSLSLLSITVSVDATFGDEAEEELPPADVFPKLTEALEDDRNWSAQVPGEVESMVTLRQIEPGDGEVLAHPLGRLEIRQTVVPLEREIAAFGNATPDPYTQFEITDVDAGTTLETSDLEEDFAPAEYFDIDDEDALDGPGYEAYEAGIRAVRVAPGYGGAADDFDAGDPTDTETVEDAWDRAMAALTYETDIIDEAGLVVWATVAMVKSTATARAACSAVAKSPRRTTGEASFAVDEDETSPTGLDGPLTVDDPGYAIVGRDTLVAIDHEDVPEPPLRKYEAKQLLDKLERTGAIETDAYRVATAHEVVEG